MGVRFAAFVGRPPGREDFRGAPRESWSTKLGFELPRERDVVRLFGSWSEYLVKLGFKAQALSTTQKNLVEQAALSHVRGVYPRFEEVAAEQNSFDGFIGKDRVEVKGASLATQAAGAALGWMWPIHRRTWTGVVDRLILVGVGFDPDTSAIIPMVRLEIPASHLFLVDGLSAISITTTGVYFGGSSKYSQFIKFRARVRTGVIHEYLRSSADEAAVLEELL